jgi:ribonuclease P protein component
MLPKKNRVDRKLIEQIFKIGRFVNSQNLSFKFLLGKDRAQKRISFVVPKSVSRSAVKRNLLRRRGYTALREHFNDFPAGLSGVFIFKTSTGTTPELEKEIKIILSKL